ncbi:MAG TPA: helix-turn-helix transcriptional regulator [Solimonas sp.]|jgi:ATP/maltotriose-dependent transcriptional regulator MalT|nr:helix-turn-helix transcriptional regulator [Solimonas sp.]
MEFGRATESLDPDSEHARFWQLNASADVRLIEPLTVREKHFLHLLAGGASNRQIAATLSVSENTVKYHLKNVYSKFAVKTRVQAVNAAIQLGMLSSNAATPAYGAGRLS